MSNYMCLNVLSSFLHSGFYKQLEKEFSNGAREYSMAYIHLHLKHVMIIDMTKKLLRENRMNIHILISWIALLLWLLYFY